jgi:hypothetical protein
MADDDDFGMGGIEDRDGYAVASAAGELSTIEWGSKVLTAMALLAGILWVLATGMLFWSNWKAYDRGYPSGMIAASIDNDRLISTIGVTLQSTWGYLLVAVVAYTGAMLLHGQRMRLLIATMSDDD